MKKRKHILLWVILALLVVLGAVAFLQRETIGAVIQGLRYSPEELTRQLEENHARIQSAIQNHPELAVREMTEAEKQALREGSLSREEMIRRLVEPDRNETTEPAEQRKPEKDDPSENHESISENHGSTVGTPPNGPENTSAAVSASPTEPPHEEGTSDSPAPGGEKPELPVETEEPQFRQYRTELSTLVAEVYVLQEEYNTVLQDMVEQAKREYAGKTEAERTKPELVKWASGYVSRATELEKECDVKMDEIAVRMVSLIRKNKGDDSIVREITVNYAEEKSLKKAWYMSEMQNRGLLG